MDVRCDEEDMKMNKINANPDAWMSIDQTIGPTYGKIMYDKLPIQSLNPLTYKHEKLFSEQTVDALLSDAY